MTQADNDKLDFGKLLDQHLGKLNTQLKVGQKVRGPVTRIDRGTVFVDLNATSEGMLDRVELLDAEGQITVKVGDEVDAIVVRYEDGEIRLGRKSNAAATDAALMDAYEARIPVEGKVSGEIKGGFEVTVGNTRGFCPYSQIDINKQDAVAYLGLKLLFQIQRCSENGRELVLNRRILLEAERGRREQELKERLAVGDRLPGTVRKIMPFGVFVDIGGIDGMIPLSELAWKRGVNPDDIVKQGQEVTVVVREIDWDRKRISLSLKAAGGDPWTSISERLVVGMGIHGVVTQLMPFGAFVELEPGIEGLIPISRLGAGRRIRDAGEVVKIGQEVEVVIESMDLERRRFSLALAARGGQAGGGQADAEQPPAPAEPVRAAAPAPVSADGAAAAAAAPAAPTVAVGLEVKGVVEGIKEFGVFLRLPNGKTGLLHVSEMGMPNTPTRLRTMHNQYAAGKEVAVVVKSMEGDRISLTLPETLAKAVAEAEATADVRQFANSAPALGSLGSMLNLDTLKLADAPAAPEAPKA